MEEPKPGMEERMKRRQKNWGITIVGDTTLEEDLQFYAKHQNSIAIHGKRAALEKVLVNYPYNFRLEMSNGMDPHWFFGHTKWPTAEEVIAAKKNNCEAETVQVPPDWYPEFCAYCKEHADHHCALLITGITKCEPSTQVLLNYLILENRLVPFGGSVDWPLPENSSVVLLVENKDEADYPYYHLTDQVLSRLFHVSVVLDENGQVVSK